MTECKQWACSYHATNSESCNYFAMALAGKHRYSLTCGSLPKRYKWTSEEEQLLTQLYPTTPKADLIRIMQRSALSIYQRAHRLGLKKDEQLVKLNGFQKGCTPFNKGMKLEDFVKGEKLEKRRAFLASTSNTNIVRAAKEGAVSTRYNGYYVKLNGKWIRQAVVCWEQANGPIPEGKTVAHIGSKFDDSLSNLLLVDKYSPSATMKYKSAAQLKEISKRQAETRKRKANALINELKKAQNSLDYKPQI